MGNVINKKIFFSKLTKNNYEFRKKSNFLYDLIDTEEDKIATLMGMGFSETDSILFLNGNYFDCDHDLIHDAYNHMVCIYRLQNFTEIK